MASRSLLPMPPLQSRFCGPAMHCAHRLATVLRTWVLLVFLHSINNALQLCCLLSASFPILPKPTSNSTVHNVETLVTAKPRHHISPAPFFVFSFSNPRSGQTNICFSVKSSFRFVSFLFCHWFQQKVLIRDAVGTTAGTSAEGKRVENAV